MNPNAKKLLLGCAGCASLFMLLVCLAIAGLAAYTTWTTIAAPPTPVAQTTSLTPSPSPAAPTAVPPITPAPQHPITPSPHHLITPSPTLTAQPLPTATPSAYPLLSAAKNVTQDPIPPRAAADLAALLTADYPPNDYFEVANRLGRAGLTARTVTAPRYQVGDTRSFFTDEGSIDATLLAVTEHAYFWVETGLNLDATAVAAAADRLETRYYPRLTALFGEAWQPGVDNDPRFAILHLRLPVDAAELGFFASLDQYPQSLYSDSNQQEMVYLNMAELDLNEDLYDGTLVHELQHLSQWFLDPNETAWLNEGLSQLAELVVGLHTAETTAYLEQPDIRLNTWEYDEETIDAHYAGAYLFSVYLWEQLGETAVHELVRHPANGMAAVDAALRGYDSRTLPAFFGDWAAANYLDDPAAGAAYSYAALALAPPVVERRVLQLHFRHAARVPHSFVPHLSLPVAGA
ncbi:MAG: hypothetical protein KC425_04730, partial [Anaerolineales bacterium]|nr:hypothetical protein [Anaerolineales bacterium]